MLLEGQFGVLVDMVPEAIISGSTAAISSRKVFICMGLSR